MRYEIVFVVFSLIPEVSISSFQKEMAKDKQTRRIKVHNIIWSIDQGATCRKNQIWQVELGVWEINTKGEWPALSYSKMQKVHIRKPNFNKGNSGENECYIIMEAH